MRINGNWNKSGSSTSRLHHPADIVSGCPAMRAQPPIHPRTRAGQPGEGAQWFQRPLGPMKSQKTVKNLVISLAYRGAVHGLPGYCHLKTTPWGPRSGNAKGRLSRFSNINLNESMENGRSIVIGETFSANKYSHVAWLTSKEENQHSWPTI